MIKSELMKGARTQNSAYWRDLHSEQRGSLNAVGYPALGQGFNRAAYKIRLAAAETLLKRVGLQGSNLLEAAVGVGAYLPLWQRLGFTGWTGVDISASAIQDLSTRYPWGNFMVVDLTTPGWAAGLPSSAFDLVTAVDILYHIVDDAGFVTALQNLAVATGKDGCLLVSDIFCDNPATTAPHVRRRPLIDYEAVLGPLGFTLIDRQPVFAFLADPIPACAHGFTPKLLYGCWRVISGLITRAPAGVKDVFAYLLVRSLAPLDKLACSLRITRGANLELAMFRRNRE